MNIIKIFSFSMIKEEESSKTFALSLKVKVKKIRALGVRSTQMLVKINIIEMNK